MQGVNFEGLTRVLGLMAITALSKPSFQHLYPTYQVSHARVPKQTL